MKRLCLTVIVLLVFFFSFPFSTPISAQSANLENVSDVLNTMRLAEIAEHMVTFKLPINASPLRRVEYIQIYLPNFVSITLPTHITGPYTGTPQYSISGTYVRITGITVVPGAQLTVHGITARNPAVEGWWPVTVLLTEDEAGIIVKSSGNTTATPSQGTITLTAQIETPSASLDINGITGPDTYVTFTKLGAVMGTDFSGPDGHFGKVFSGLVPETQSISVFGTDLNQLTTSPISIIVYTPAFQVTTVSNQILSPTISINKNTFTDGEDINLSGSAVPNGNITIFTQAPLRTYSTVASSSGTWSYTITNTEEYVMGDYQVLALVQSPLGLTSINSPALGFTIATTFSGTPCGEISNGDLNCDDAVDLTDFSILMYWWGTVNAIADVNNDNVVNLSDFSIMMYWWGT